MISLHGMYIRKRGTWIDKQALDGVQDLRTLQNRENRVRPGVNMQNPLGYQEGTGSSHCALTRDGAISYGASMQIAR